MKWTKYLHVSESKTGNINIYNIKNDNIIQLLPALWNIIQSQWSEPENLKSIHPTLFEDLKSRDFLVPAESDEYSMVKNDIINRLSDKKIFRLIINPTMDCNLRCWYCYEEHLKNSQLSQELTNSILSLISNKISDAETEVLHLTFFGGEPLMKFHSRALPIIIKAKDMCDEKKIRFQLDFVSNGTLLTEHVINSLSNIASNINFQIAFDGGRDTHDKTKYYANGRGTYNDVLKNINSGLANDMFFNIRCNYTSENIDSFFSLVEDIKSLPNYDSEKIRFSLQRVWQAKAYKTLEEKVEHLQTWIDGGIDRSSSDIDSVPSHCYASMSNCYVVNYDGNVYKCTAREFSKENMIGRLSKTGEIEFNPKYHNILDIRFHDECKDCNLLPICTFCHQQHIEHNGNCPKQISSIDKDAQISRRIEMVHPEYL